MRGPLRNSLRRAAPGTGCDAAGPPAAEVSRAPCSPGTSQACRATRSAERSLRTAGLCLPTRRVLPAGSMGSGRSNLAGPARPHEWEAAWHSRTRSFWVELGRFLIELGVDGRPAAGRVHRLRGPPRTAADCPRPPVSQRRTLAAPAQGGVLVRQARVELLESLQAPAEVVLLLRCLPDYAISRSIARGEPAAPLEVK